MICLLMMVLEKNRTGAGAYSLYTFNSTTIFHPFLALSSALPSVAANSPGGYEPSWLIQKEKKTAWPQQSLPLADANMLSWSSACDESRKWKWGTVSALDDCRTS